MPEQEVLLQLGAAQVQVAVAQTQVLARQLLVGAAVDGDRERLGTLRAPSSPPPAPRSHRRAARGSHWIRAKDAPLHLHHVLRAQLARLLQDRRRRPLRVEGDLHQAAAVAEVQEDEAAEIAAAVHPSRRVAPCCRCPPREASPPPTCGNGSRADQSCMREVRASPAAPGRPERRRRHSWKAARPASTPAASATQSPNSGARPGTKPWCTSSERA